MQSGTDQPVFNKSLSSSSSDSGVDVRPMSRSMDVVSENQKNTVKHSCSPTTKTVSATFFEGCKEHNTHTQGEDSPDFPENTASQAVARCYSKLVSAIVHQLTVDQFASDLYSNDLIEYAAKCDAQTQGLTNTQKAASTLLDAVMHKIRLSESSVQPFHRFVQLLKKYSCGCEIVTEIMDHYEQLKQSQQDTRCNQRKNEEQNDIFNSMPAQSQTKTVQPSSIKFGVPSADRGHQLQKSQRLLLCLCFC